MQDTKLADCLYCGVQPMDDDHTLLLNLLNELKFAAHNDVNMLIIRICDVINAHATHEEHLMMDYKYEELAFILHMADHHTRFAEVRELVAQLRIDEAIKELARHIVKYDVPLAKFIKSQQKMIDTSQ